MRKIEVFAQHGWFMSMSLMVFGMILGVQRLNFLVLHPYLSTRNHQFSMKLQFLLVETFETKIVDGYPLVLIEMETSPTYFGDVPAGHVGSEATSHMRD